MSKRISFEEFKPSFISVGFGWTPDLFELAFLDGSAKLLPLLDNLPDSTGDVEVEVEGVVGQGGERPLRFGHLPEATNKYAADLSGAAPYRLTISFGKDDRLTSVKLTLFFLNPRVLLTDTLFIPCKRLGDGRFDKQTPGAAPCGLVIVAVPEPEIALDVRFANLTKGVPKEAFAPPPTGTQYDEQTLIGRIDVWIEWRDDDLAKYSTDLFGRNIGTPGGSLPADVDNCTVQLFSPGISEAVQVWMDVTQTIGLELAHKLTDGIKILLDTPKEPSAAKLFSKALVEFNLAPTFKGVLFEGIRLHLLNDAQAGQDGWPSLGLSLAAFSFDSAGDSKTHSAWYAGFEAGMQAEPTKPYFGLFNDARLHGCFAEDQLAAFSVSGTIKQLDPPYSWLAGRSAVLALRSQPWKDLQGTEHPGMAISLGLESMGDKVLATLNKDQPVPMTADAFSQVAVVMTLAPIVLASNPVNPPDGAHPPDDRTRGYFVPIRSAQGMGELYAMVGLGWFFKEAVKVNELRVIGVRMQRQPAKVNKPDAGDEYQTALLFDYEADYSIDFGPDNLKTARSLTARIDGTGIMLHDEDFFSWVQVPSGLHELSVADPALWDVTGIGKWFKVVDVLVRRKPAREMVIRLRLTGNTDIVTAGDFVFVVPLEGEGNVKIDAFPSKISAEIGGVKGIGTLAIKNDGTGRTVIGSLDLEFPSGFRIFGAARVSDIEDSDAKATIFTGRVHFAAPKPVFSTGAGWTGIDAVVATHMMRREPPGTPGVPPALSWLESVKGDVVKSISDYPASWEVAENHTAVGIGVTVELLALGGLLNMNAMLVIEQPGPRILIFTKVNLLKEPVGNQKASEDLKRGIIGVLDIDPEHGKLTLSALVNVQFKDLVTVRAPIQLFLDSKETANWHFFIGHHAEMATAKLNLFGLSSLSASGYLMAAGKVIKGVPIYGGGPRDLPGLAVAFGLGAQLVIGGGSLCVRGGIQTYLLLSFGDGIYVGGMVVLSGELRLFGLTIGASGSLRLDYSRNSHGKENLYLEGSISGHYKDMFFEIEGSLTVKIGTSLTEPISLPPLALSVTLISGANVSLRGQGSLGPIDGTLGDASRIGSSEVVPGPVPLDTVIALSMAQPPSTEGAANDFAGLAPKFNQNESEFTFGNQAAQYNLKSVKLYRHRLTGLEEVDYQSCPARWWESAQPSKSGIPSPKILALMTRDPLSAKNSIVSPEQLSAWIDSILGSICDVVTLPQPCWYSLGTTDAGTPLGGEWIVPAVLRDTKTEGMIGRRGATQGRFALNPRPGSGADNDPIPGFPPYPGTCIIEPGLDPESTVPVLSFYSRLLSVEPRLRVSSTVLITGDMAFNGSLDLLVAHAGLGDGWYFDLALSDNSVVSMSYDDLRNRNAVGNLQDKNVQGEFYKNAERWKLLTLAFEGLKTLPRYANFGFWLIRIDFSALPQISVNSYPESLTIHFNDDVPADHLVDAILGGVRFTPKAELERYQNDLNHQQDVIESLKDFLVGKPIPLLEPASDYEVRVEWLSEINGVPLPIENATYTFKTTNEPPLSAIPYLLATFPQSRERFHYTEDVPGFCLGSTDALRMLMKFPDARLKVVITEDGGTEVFDKTGTLRWDRGVLVDPANLVDPATPSPLGFENQSVTELPSALKEALIAKLGTGKPLSCLDNINPPAGGIWIGFDVRLRPLCGYKIAVDVVHTNGSLWQTGSAADHFVDWQFSTALHSNLAAHVAQLTNVPLRHKVVARTLNDAFASESDVVIAEKLFEDLLVASLGEAPSRSGEARKTLLWRKDVESKKLLPAALLIESNEPLLRTTRSVRIASRSGPTSETLIAEPEDLLLQSIDNKKSRRAAGATFSSSGFSALVRIDAAVSGDLVLEFARYAVDRIPSALPNLAWLTVAATTLAARSTREE